MAGRPNGNTRWLPLLVAMAVSIFAGLVLAYLDSVDRDRQLQQARATVAERLSTIRARLEYALNAPLLRARGVVAYIVSNGGITRDQFATVAEVLLKDQRNVRNIVVSHGLVIAMTYPMVGNESILGVNFQSVPTQYASVQRAIDARTSLLQGPVPLIQGGSGLILRTPVFLPGPKGGESQFYGMVNVILDIPAILADAHLSDPDLALDIAIRGQDGLGEQGGMIFGKESVFQDSAIAADVRLVMGSWHMAATPKGGWSSVDYSNRTRLMAILVFLAMVVTAFGTAFHVIGAKRIENELLDKSQRLESVNASLERSNADLERFAYLASHDLQTPLRNVSTYAQLLARRYRGQFDADADTFIGFIVDGAQRMLQMVDELLDYARLSNSAVTPQAVSAAEIMDMTVKALSATIEEAGAVIRVGPLPTVRADRHQMARLLQNLVDNALKYRADDRPLEIEIAARQDQPGWWTISISDNGIGIDPQYFDQIFIVFRRLHISNERGGTGIGLAVCQRIVQQAGGRMWVESSVGSGATFLFTVPAA